jgi:hypothetical protein
MNWYIKEGYNVNFPNQIRERIHQGEIPSDSEISDAVLLEFDQKEYEERKQNLIREWKETNEFFKKNY